MAIPDRVRHGSRTRAPMDDIQGCISVALGWMPVADRVYGEPGIAIRNSGRPKLEQGTYTKGLINGKGSNYFWELITKLSRL